MFSMISPSWCWVSIVGRLAPLFNEQDPAVQAPSDFPEFAAKALIEREISS
jgi:hypothetical protein